MLPFGSLLTQLPLLIIGVLYMLYLGLCAVNRSQGTATDDVSEAKELFINKDYSGHTADFNTFIRIFKEKSKDQAEKSPGIYSDVSYTDIPFFIPDEEISLFLPAHFKNSRPPPFVI